jgi:uncharacterized membrane protein
MEKRNPSKAASGERVVPNDGVNAWIWVAAALVWGWSLALLCNRESLVELYLVISSAPPLWGFLILPISMQAVIIGLAIILGAVGIRNAKHHGARWPKSVRWLSAAALVPLLDAMRSLGLAVPYTFLEPLVFSFVTGMAVGNLVREAAWRSESSGKSARWFWLVVGLSAGACGWWYWEGVQAYENYLLGYHDFGHFARRVINTWEGRGWLMESPGVPAFWDHFNPGLILLAPLWGICRDVRLFLGLQAVCLASPALLVFGIARRYDCDGPTSAAWSVVYLAVPSVGLLNLSYSYGWHPVSVAIPLMFLAVWALLCGWRTGALLALVLACSFKESVVVVSGCLAASLALQAWLARGRSKGGWRGVWGHRVGESRLAEQLPVWGWLVIWAALVVAFLLIARYAAFMKFQTGRFASLGDSPLMIALSPLLRPAAFWGQMLRYASLCFLLGLLVPWHLPNLARGWPLLIALSLPMTVLLVWDHGPAASLAFQYISELLVILFLAALSGSCRAVRGPADNESRAVSGESRRVGAFAALGASLTAAALFGSLPWSSPTLNVMISRSYEIQGERDFMFNPRAVGTPGHALLESVVARVEQHPDASVVATGRIASHLLRVRRLESVEQALVRWDLLAREMGTGRSPIEAFDWVVLDQYEQFQQSLDRTYSVLIAARDAGYGTVLDKDGLIVLRRPETERR